MLAEIPKSSIDTLEQPTVPLGSVPTLREYCEPFRVPAWGRRGEFVTSREKKIVPNCLLV